MATQSPVMALVIPANEYRRERWRNGAGWTRAIAAGGLGADAGGIAGSITSAITDGIEGASDAWEWRLSIAEIERDAAYSALPGIDREQVLLSGNGLRLRLDGGDQVELMPPHGRCRFDGGARVQATLVEGPVHVFNLMWRRTRAQATLWHRPLVGPMVLFVEPASLWVVHLLAGLAHFDADAGLPSMAAGDTALLAAGDSRQRYAFEGGGELLLVRIETADSATDESPAVA